MTEQSPPDPTTPERPADPGPQPSPLTWQPPPPEPAAGATAAGAPAEGVAAEGVPADQPPHPAHHHDPGSFSGFGFGSGVGGTALAEMEAGAEVIEEEREDEAGREKTKEERERERFRSIVAVLIALVSILGAVVAFRGSITEQRAVRLDQDGIQEQARKEQIVTDLQATVNSDLRRLGSYQEHVKAAEILDSDATELQSSDKTLAQTLSAQADAERVLALSQQQFFRAAVPTEPTIDKPLQYDAAAALAGLEADDADLKQLRPDATIGEADDAHHKAATLTGLVTIFIGALLFLTLAQFTGPFVRRIFAGAGVLTAAGGLVAWLLVERFMAS